MSALQRRCWVAATIEGVILDGTCCRGQRRRRVLRAAGSGGISRGSGEVEYSGRFGDDWIEVQWEMKNTALE